VALALSLPPLEPTPLPPHCVLGFRHVPLQERERAMEKVLQVDIAKLELRYTRRAFAWGKRATRSRRQVREEEKFKGQAARLGRCVQSAGRPFFFLCFRRELFLHSFFWILLKEWI